MKDDMALGFILAVICVAMLAMGSIVTHCTITGFIQKDCKYLGEFTLYGDGAYECKAITTPE